jgi:hypothetical protein
MDRNLRLGEPNKTVQTDCISGRDILVN